MGYDCLQWTPPQEADAMLKRIVAATRRLVVNAARSLGEIVKRSMKPARSVAAVTAGVAADMAKTRPELMAENALLCYASS